MISIKVSEGEAQETQKGNGKKSIAVLLYLEREK